MDGWENLIESSSSDAEPREYSLVLATAVERTITERGWNAEFDTQTGIYTLRFHTENNLPYIDLQINVGEFEIIATAFPGIMADEHCQTQVVEFLTRANHHLIDGLFRFDYSDGEMSAATALVGLTELDPDRLPDVEMIGDWIGVPVERWLEFGDGLLDVMYQGVAPELAITRIRENAAEEE